MSRSEEVRQQALEAEGYRCAVCGRDCREESERSNLHVHHIACLGMGGSEELDVLENAISICWECHAKTHSGAFKIARWDRKLGIMEVLDVERHKVDHSKLWFHRRKLAEELEPIEARIQGLHAIDGRVARDLWTLKKDHAYKVLDDTVRSWKEFAGSRGWDIQKATRLADLWFRSLASGIEWGENESESDYAKRLRAAGITEDRSYFYLQVRKDGKFVFWKSNDEQGLRGQMAIGDILVKAGKFLWGVRSEDGKLIGPDKRDLPFLTYIEEKEEPKKEIVPEHDPFVGGAYKSRRPE
jgi:hypothetical protein